MITDFFKSKTETPKPIINEYFELHRAFVKRNSFIQIYNEVKNTIVKNSSRQSCVCLNKEQINIFKIYNLPLIELDKYNIKYS